ncbi:MAG: amidophosphoribosyltransferase [Clostridia bacterium]
MQNGYKPKEECGIFGIFDNDGLDCSQLTYYGLFSLQHRGQESCGIAVSSNRDIKHYKNMGLVNEVFTNDVLSLLKGEMAIGHVRYSTTGESRRENSQPLVTKYVKGTLAIAHNGNLTNGGELREEFENRGLIFQTTIDSEAIAYVIARERLNSKSVEEAVIKSIPYIKGAYALLVMSPQKLIAARDIYGLKPLSIGKIGNSWVFASETCALDAVGAEFVRDVEPGEVVLCDRERGLVSYKNNCRNIEHKMCIFEYIYFARPDSKIAGMSVYEARKNAGRLLAKTHPVEADIVVGVPDSGLDAAIGYSEESGIPYEHGFIKNRYIGRTFIQPSQEMRERSVRLKLNPLREIVEGKRVVMIDDSIVRGTTCKRIVGMMKDAGAKEVHMRVSSPPFLYPCYFGTDIPSQELLVSWQRSVEEVRQIINADTLGFLPADKLGEMISGACTGCCDACFTGKYPMPVPYDKIREERGF